LHGKRSERAGCCAGTPSTKSNAPSSAPPHADVERDHNRFARAQVGQILPAALLEHQRRLGRVAVAVGVAADGEAVERQVQFVALIVVLNKQIANIPTTF
jgi:hypothetical protein